MDWVKLRSYSRKRRAQQNIHCASPIPAAAASAAPGERNAKAKGCRLRLDLLSEPQQEPRVRRQIGNALPKIQEANSVTQMDSLSVKQSTELNDNENRSMEVNKSINNMATAELKDSLHLNSSSKESLRYSETTSGMTLPTGVSHFLLQCLDEESSVCSNTESSDGASTYSSPEIFRDENTLEESCTSPEAYLGHRNSTLLDTSKAIDIDKMPLVPNLSQILETTLRKKNQSITRLSKQKSRSELAGVSVVVAGKQVCKFLPAKEKTHELQYVGATLLPQKQTEKLDSSSVHKVSLGEAFLPSTSCSNVNSKEVIPATLPPGPIPQFLHNLPEICCIIKASPRSRPLKVLQHPVKRKRVFPPPGANEDIITSSKC